jgi:hypothetical protein
MGKSTRNAYGLPELSQNGINHLNKSKKEVKLKK